MRRAGEKRKIAITIIGIIVAVVFIAAVFNSYIISAILSAERIGFYEISAMRAARTNNETSLILTINDAEVQFPLPNGAVEFESTTYPLHNESKQFLITTEAFRYYVDVLLPQNGFFKYEQLGTFMVMANENMRVGIITSMLTRNFMRIEIISVEVI